MRVFHLNIPKAVSAVRALELSKEARQRLRVLEWYWAHGKNGRLTCRHFGISPDTFHRWKRRSKQGGPACLENGSRRPPRVRQPTWSPELERTVLQLRSLTPGWWKDKLVVLLREEGWQCSTSMVGRILRKLKESGQLVEAPIRDPWQQPRRFRRPYGIRKPKEYLARAPGDTIQVDTADIRPLPGWSFKHFTACDVITRWHVLEARSRATAPAAASFLDAILERTPFPIRAIQVDGGSEFMAQFEIACQERGIQLFVLPPRSPKLNGHVERAQRTHREEFYRFAELPHSRQQINKMLRTWEDVHNCYRPHQALGYKTPRSFYQQLLTLERS